MDYDLDEKRAAVNDRGLHATRVQNPADFRAASAQAAQKAPDIGCQIKGNISSKGVRIYHLRGQEQYERTRISTLKGERWFCSEAEAKAAGWRRARR
jgi:predicted anti-sigma-YlaC factor YlaD